MNVNNVIRTITIKGTEEGVDEVTGKLNKLADAQKNVAVVSEKSSTRVLSLEDAWKKQTLKLDEAARSQANIARETKVADGALREGLITQQQHAERLNLISQRYAAATVQAGKFANQTGLNRYEILNLSRQMQDVGVSLAGGQSPFVVLTQQGSQILDVFQASSGSVRGFFSQIANAAGGALGTVTGFVWTVALGFGTIATAQHAADAAMVDLRKGLSATGRFAQVTTGDLVNLGKETSSAFGLSQKEAREAASAFAGMGVQTKENIGAANRVVLDFSKTIGVSLEDGIKVLGKGLTSGIEGIDGLAASLGGLTAAQRRYLQDLDANLDKTKFQAEAIRFVSQNVSRATELTTGWGLIWTEVSNKISNAGQKLQEFSVKAAEAMGMKNSSTPAGLNSQIVGLEDQRSALRGALGGMGPRSTAAAQEEIASLTAKIGELRLEMTRLEGTQLPFARMGQDALTAAEGFTPLIAKAEEMRRALDKIEQARANPEVRSTLSPQQNSQLDAAAQAGQLQVRLANEAVDAEQRRVGITQQIADNYQGISVKGALILDQLKDQLNVAQAVGGAAKIAAQEEATRLELIRQGKTEYEAASVAAAQRAVSEAQVTSNIQEQVKAINQQTELMKAARLGGPQAEARVKAEQAYKNAIDAGADSAAAAALKVAILRQEHEKLAGSIYKVISSEETAAQSMSEYGAHISALGGTVNDYLNSVTTPGGSSATGKGGDFVTDIGYGIALANQKALAEAKVVALQAKASSSNLFDDAQRTLAEIELAQAQKEALQKEFDQKHPHAFGMYDINLESDRILLNAKTDALETRINDLKNATDKNTEATKANTLSLNPLYSQGHSALKIGYYQAASGLDMMVRGGTPGVDSVPVPIMAQQGERIIVVPPGGRAPGNDNAPPPVVSQPMIMNFTFGSDSTSNRRRSMRQFAQGFAQTAAAMR